MAETKALFSTLYSFKPIIFSLFLSLFYSCCHLLFILEVSVFSKSSNEINSFFCTYWFFSAVLIKAYCRLFNFKNFVILQTEIKRNKMKNEKKKCSMFHRQIDSQCLRRIVLILQLAQNGDRSGLVSPFTPFPSQTIAPLVLKERPFRTPQLIYLHPYVHFLCKW